VDGVHALTHPFGCSQLGDDLAHTRRILASLISHPNAGGVLVVGLGCESNQLSKLLAEVGQYDESRIRSFSAQATEDEIEERVHVRLQRQERLTRKDGPRLWAVVDEAAIKRPIGGPEIMREQLEHLREVSTLPNITLQVMPFRFGMHAAEGGAFTILRFPESDLSDVVYVEQLWGALYLDKREDIDPYLTAMEQLCVESTTPGLTTEILDDLHEGI